MAKTGERHFCVVAVESGIASSRYVCARIQDIAMNKIIKFVEKR